MIDHDRLVKELLTTFFVEFLDLFFPTVLRSLDPDTIEFLDKEVCTDVTSGTTYEADIVVKVRFQQQPAFFIIHLEHQTQPGRGVRAAYVSVFCALPLQDRLASLSDRAFFR